MDDAYYKTALGRAVIRSIEVKTECPNTIYTWFYVVAQMTQRINGVSVTSLNYVI